MEDDPSDTIFEVSERLMVSPTGGEPYLRIAHFLKPSITSISGPDFELPQFCPCSLPPSSLEPQDWPLKVTFSGWRNGHKTWLTWVDQMASLHQSKWKKAGIYEAIMTSTYHIRRDKSLLLGIVERWCSETKSFLFPWGEATITLEDAMIVGGYSVLGDPVLSPVECEELKEIEDKLKEARKRIVASKAKKACQSLWIKTFKNSGNEFEHQAFLACWLSRYVFVTNHQTIDEHLFPVAIQLAIGTRIALAPAVQSPFQFVQIWAWERFIEFQPKPNVLNYGDPRVARWDKVNGLKVENVRLTLDLAGESFLWRPYAMAMDGWNFPKFYAEKEVWMLVGPGLDEELLSIARCMRISELVGFGFIEQYLPHRVAMQFGMDQDLPGFVARLNELPEIAWNDYSKPISDEKLYIPPRLYKADVTARYLDWKQSMFDQQEAIKSIVPEQRIFKASEVSLPISKEEKQAEDIVVPHIPPKGTESLVESLRGQQEAINSIVPEQRGFKDSEVSLTILKEEKQAEAIVVPHIPPKGTESLVESLRGQQEAIKSIVPEQRGFKASEVSIPILKEEKQVEAIVVPHIPPKGTESLVESLRGQQEAIKSIVPEQRGFKASEVSIPILKEEKQAEAIVVPHIPPKGTESLVESLRAQLQTLSPSSSQELEIPGLALEARISKLEAMMVKLKAARFGSRVSKRTKKEGHSGP
uniref:Aminotransferase-like plant mobile domain-containing protein n=1 Tax=Fagus sylvatica TaxID=28930 RepID=A0A2N9ILY9_FAGSY